ncbi:MAG: stage IV sporulation protein A [Oscillospiraceae bacterium]|nr:stage IV sporulation protein A [Oscillospiraceae bacterium]
MQNIYSDIARRTGGDIYIGVVGPVRTGKSTFIKRFMENLVLPHMKGDLQRERAVDELPQSAAGRTIMTTEPKFIPEEAAQVELDGSAVMRVRLIDCVGYIVPSSLGYFENEQPRMVRTPWFEEEVPFNMAAEVGTSKVITDHSTVGLVITSDGSISDIPREEYEEAEERVISELAGLGKPFVILLNSKDPSSAQARALSRRMEEKYGRPVMAVSCISIGEEEIKAILAELLTEFPLKEAEIELPRWVLSLKKDHWLRTAVFAAIRETAVEVEKLGNVSEAAAALAEKCPYILRASVDRIDLGRGLAQISVTLQPKLFYQILGETTGLDISDETKLMPCLAELARCKREYDRLSSALREVEATGYGIVMPQMDELSLEEPEIVKQGSKYGVRLRASAPGIHMISTRIATEVSPIVGSEKQSEELVMSLLRDFEEDPVKIWDSNIFGKSLHDLVGDGLHAKLARMPGEARMKLQETIERIINEGCNGLVCLIL